MHDIRSELWTSATILEQSNATGRKMRSFTVSSGDDSDDNSIDDMGVLATEKLQSDRTGLANLDDRHRNRDFADGTEVRRFIFFFDLPRYFTCFFTTNKRTIVIVLTIRSSLVTAKGVSQQSTEA
ncbi:hypothetical protein TSAR_006509 [Trichomalopsis sarcophagae]|uniref:Uncharacterized protein n=1 Tax=Trichomalopsis sarcophagae TaxID=543379 RepID=A0A232EZ79_9HYME|nr:hypothetical protein TSAR_006509 [Trichomalopsis sarcophagae]